MYVKELHTQLQPKKNRSPQERNFLKNYNNLLKNMGDERCSNEDCDNSNVDEECSSSLTESSEEQKESP